MSDDLNERVEDLFTRAVHLSEEERSGFLARECGDESPLRDRVESLLAAEARMGSFLEDPTTRLAKGPQAGADEADWVSERYRLLRLIGEGGFGKVYLAEQLHPVSRKVAVKVLKPGMWTAEVIARFEAERQALAIMDHPNIAKILDGGATPRSGRPFFVMEWVQGAPITRFCDDNHLPLNERLELFCEVCAAVQHAHQKGVLHRDLKPSNILASMHGDDPLVRVIDFGVAVALEGRLSEAPDSCGPTTFVGTPAYMSPEQVDPGATDVDTRSDVYSLGTLLYELLTGATPHDGRELARAGRDGWLEILRSRPPARPSTRARGTAHADGSRKALRIAADLDCIVSKAIEFDRARRYEGAAALAADIERYLGQEPVAAHPPSAQYRFSRFFRRNKILVVAASLVATSFLIGLVIALLALSHEKRARDATEKMRYASDMRLAVAAVRDGDVDTAFALLDQHGASRAGTDRRAWEWYHVDSFRRREIASLRPVASISEVGSTPDGRSVVVGLKVDGGERRLGFFDAATLNEIGRVSGPMDEWIGEFTFLRGGRELAVDADVLDLEARTWRSIASPELLELLWPHKISADGRWLIGAFDPTESSPSAPPRGQPHRLLLCCIEIDSLRAVSTESFVAPDGRMLDHELRISPDSRMLALACADATVRIYSIPGLEVLHELAVAGTPTCLGWSADSDSLGVGCELPDVAQVWDRRTATLRAPLDRGVQKSSSWDICLTPDGSLLAVSTLDKLIILWDLARDPPEERAVFRGHETLPTSLAFLADGSRLVSADGVGELKIWDTSAAPSSPLGGLPDELVGHLDFSPDGHRLAVLSRDGRVRIYSTESGRLDLILEDEPVAARDDGTPRSRRFSPLSYSSDGRFIVLGTQDGSAVVHDLTSTGPAGRLVGHSGPVNGVAMSADCATVFTASEDGTLRSWDRVSGAPLEISLNPVAGEALYAVDCSPDGRLVAVGGRRMSLTLRETKSHDLVAALPHDKEKSYRVSITSARFSPDGKRLACGLRNELILFDVPSLEVLAEFSGLSGSVLGTDFSPDGRNLVGVSQRGGSVLVNLGLLHDVGDVTGSGAGWISACFSPDGRILAVSGLGAGVRYFRASPRVGF